MQNDIVKQPPSKSQTSQPAQPPAQAAAAEPAKPAISSVPSQSQTIPNATDTHNKDQHQTKQIASRRPTAVIAVAVVVCLILIGLALYATQKNTSTSSTIKPQVTQQQTQQTPAAAVEEVLSETEGIPEITDDVSPELSDQALGL